MPLQKSCNFILNSHLNLSISSRKFTRPLDTKCDVYIFVDARVTELRLSTLRSNFKVRMADLQCYSSNSINRGILILFKKSSGCVIENAVLVDKDSTVLFDLKTLDGDPINCAAVYGPSKDKPEYWEINETCTRTLPWWFHFSPLP